MGVLRIGTECSGICALSAALDRLQVDVDYAFACECDSHCQKQLRALAVPPNVIYENMEIRDAASMPVVDLYVLGSPCQSYSYLGKRKGAEEMRGFLIFKGIEYIKLKLPTYFILENVKGFYTVQKGSVYKEVMAQLEGLNHYHISVQTVNTKDYGVPQSRHRMYIVGVPKSRPKYEFPPSIPCKPLHTFLDDNLPPSELSESSKTSLKHYGNLIKDLHDTNRIVDLSATKNYVRRGELGICPCVRIHSNYFYSSKHKRYLSLRECLRLQGFPDTWVSQCSPTQTRKQCGNAMSVNVLYELVKKLLNESQIDASGPGSLSAASLPSSHSA